MTEQGLSTPQDGHSVDWVGLRVGGERTRLKGSVPERWEGLSSGWQAPEGLLLVGILYILSLPVSFRGNCPLRMQHYSMC